MHSGKTNTVFNSLLLTLTLGRMKPCSILSTKAAETNHLTVITHLYPDESSGRLWGHGSDGISCCSDTASMCVACTMPGRSSSLLLGSFSYWFSHRAPIACNGSPVLQAMVKCVLSLRQQACCKTTNVFLSEKLLPMAKLFLPAVTLPVVPDLWYLLSTAPIRFLGVVEVKGCCISSFY